MKALAIIINIFFPGFGTFFVGRPGAAIAQIALSVTGVFLTFTGIGSIIGIPLCIVAWIWALVSAASAPSVPTEVVVTHRGESQTYSSESSVANIAAAAVTNQGGSLSNATRKCPACAEDVRLEAKICRFCQRELPPLTQQQSEILAYGLCPNCDTKISTSAAECPNQKCKAMFGIGSAWSIKPLPPQYGQS